MRDLLDSMYRGFPVGYLMLWNAAEVDGRVIGADGKQHTPRSSSSTAAAPDQPVCRHEGQAEVTFS